MMDLGRFFIEITTRGLERPKRKWDPLPNLCFYNPVCRAASGGDLQNIPKMVPIFELVLFTATQRQQQYSPKLDCHQGWYPADPKDQRLLFRLW